jgi:hypothetical protein
MSIPLPLYPPGQSVAVPPLWALAFRYWEAWWRLVLDPFGIWPDPGPDGG